MTKKKEPNEILKEQLQEGFEILPNAKMIADQFIKSLDETLDITKEPEDVLVGVGKISDLELDSLDALNKWDSLSDALFLHKRECPMCRENEDDCEEREEMIEFAESSDWEVFTDGEFKEDVELGNVDVIGETFTIRLNYDVNTFQVLKSPLIIKRGLASLCYPNQADLDREGNYECYGLPKEYKREE